MVRSYLSLAILIFIFAFLLARTPATNVPTEIERIKSLSTTDMQAQELRKLLDKVGPVEAQELMLRSGLPFTGQTHLLIHVIGDYVYEKFGSDGLIYCRDYFLSACYHGFILNTLGDHGFSGMIEVMEKCSNAAPGVASQCAHGTGHGFVAWHDYDLVKALKMCDELGAETTNFPYFNCYDGVFMENVWGVHEGRPSPKRWVKPEDSYYPCNDPRIPEKYLGGCWANQATLAYQYLRGDLRKTAEFCDSAPAADYRDTCYNNLYRQIHPLTRGEVKKVFSLCQAATGKDRQDECVLTNMGAYFSVGDRTLPRKICEAAEPALRHECLVRLDGMIKYYGE